MTLEVGTDPLPEGVDVAWLLGGLNIDDGPIWVVGDDGLEGIATDTQDNATVVDGSRPGIQRLTPREVTLTLAVGEPGTEASPAAIADAMAALELVLQPLPDRINGLRALRWRRYGQPGRRLYYRPANGQALSVAGDEARVKYDDAAITVRIECPDGVIVSDEYTDYVFTAGQTRDIVNNGTLCSILPLAYSVSAPAGVTLTHADFPHESITYPSPSGGVTVSRRMEIVTPTTYGIAYGPGSSHFPDPPYLRPGSNHITASAGCTLRKWDTF